LKAKKKRRPNHNESPEAKLTENIRILKMPTWIMRRMRKAQAFCVPQKSILYVSLLFFVPEFTLRILYVFYPHPLLAISMFMGLILLGIPAFLMVIIAAFRIVVIRKQCNECQFRFHIIAHELTHLKLNSLNEKLVEEETLKHTGDRLFPILLSNPKLCKDCVFRRKMYVDATTEYAESKEREKKE
jgi:hypothetical protein